MVVIVLGMRVIIITKSPSEPLAHCPMQAIMCWIANAIPFPSLLLSKLTPEAA